MTKIAIIKEKICIAGGKIAQGMGKRKQESKAYGKYTHYWPKDMQPFLMTATNITTGQTWGCSPFHAYVRSIE